MKSFFFSFICQKEFTTFFFCRNDFSSVWKKKKLRVWKTSRKIGKFQIILQKKTEQKLCDVNVE